MTDKHDEIQDLVMPDDTENISVSGVDGDVLPTVDLDDPIKEDEVDSRGDDQGSSDEPEEIVDEPGKKRILGSAQRQSGERNWYVIHTYSGYEDQVSESLMQRIDSFGMKDKIFDVIVPKEKQIEIKGGKRKVVEKRIFPGYVLVDMVVTDESWFVVRNTPNVTGFIGFGVKPTPMSNQEVERIKKRMGVEEPKYKIELKIDDLVRVNDGPLKGFEGKVTDIDEDKGRVKVLVSMFGRETPVTLDYLQVKSV